MPPSPLAQDYVVVGRVPSDDLIIDDPALTKLPGGGLLATWTYRHWAEGADINTNAGRFHLARSDDSEETWQELPPLDICMGLPFVQDGRLYLLGNEFGRENVIISRSDDEGESWQPFVTLFLGRFWNAPTAFAIAQGHMYRAFGTTNDQGVFDDKTVVVAGDLSGDLMAPSSWRMSPPVGYPGTPEALKAGIYPPGSHPFVRKQDHWLEPNVVDVRGRLRVFIRTRIDGLATAGMCGVCDLEDDGRDLSLRFRQFHPMPGAQCKFYVIYDEVSDLFWTPANLPTDPQNTTGWADDLPKWGIKGTPGNERRFLILLYSRDALSWFQAGCIAMSPSPRQSFHYVAPLVDGDDMLFLSRTTVDGRNQHDSDVVTFHRVPGFRSLAYDLHPSL